ncbi:MAG: NUDIX hydrolase [Cetobacterium sp.]
MNYYEEILEYLPKNEQEVKDKELILDVMEKYEDILTRKNIVAHLTASGFIINREKTKVLMIHHNIYNSWGWTGGHMDGDRDLKKVALKEAREETGGKNFEILNDKIATLDVIPVKSHYKNGNFVSAHLHLSIGYILIGDDSEVVQIKEDENSGVQWIDIERVMEYTENEPHMQYIYGKLLNEIDVFFK